MKKNVVLIMLLMCTGIFLSGCLNLDTISIFYDIDKNLKGRMELKFLGMHSDEETEAEKKKEMASFYNDFISGGEDIASTWCLQDVKTELVDKTDFKCNAIITGEINNLPGSIYPITENSTFEIKKTNKIFSVKIASCKISEEDAPTEVSIRYNGKILSHNAHLFDETNNTMTWSGKNMEKTGISFVLEIDE